MPETLTTNPVATLVQKMEQDYLIGETTRSKYVTENFYEDLCTIDAYLSSKHTSGDKDSFGRVKPFFNIVLAARNIWFRATDIDRKNIRIKAGKAKDYIPSFLATVHLQDYMRRENFGQFLNDWGLVLASYNSAVCKFIEKDNRLHTVVVPWQKLIVDTVDFENNPKIEILELTEAQLRKNKEYNQKMVEALCQTVASRETIDKTKKDTKDNYIKLYEVHGELPLSYLTGKERDEDEYVQQMHIISLVGNKSKGGFDDFTLYSGREKQDPYLLTSLIKNTDGSISLNGSVKNLFEAQWMTNHSIIATKNQLDLASLLIFQTSDTKFAGQNVLANIQDGEIMIYAKDQPLTQLSNTSHDITALQSFGQQWQVLAQELTSTPDIMKGENMPSGTAFRQAAIIQQESHSNFEIMTENKGLAIEEMMRRYIIPYLKKKMDTSEEVSATLEDYDITKIDSIYIPNEAVKRFNQKAVQAVIDKTELPNLQEEMQGVKQELGTLGNQRFFKPSEISTKTWQDVFKDFEWEAEVEITDETIDKEPVLTTLSSVLQTIATNPMILQDPNARMIFNKILEETGRVSAIELSTASSQPQPQQQMVGNQPMQPQMPQQSALQIT
jgi:hypothetical protein